MIVLGIGFGQVRVFRGRLTVRITTTRSVAPLTISVRLVTSMPVVSVQKVNDDLII